MDIGKLLTDLGVPLLGAIINGPVGLATGAVKVIADTLDVASNPQAIATKLETVDAETLLKLKQLELDFQRQMIQAQVQMEQIQTQDRSSARQRELGIVQATGEKDWGMFWLGTGVITGFFLLVAALLYLAATRGDQAIDPNVMAMLNILLGTLAAGFTGVLSYYFGSSAGSSRKDALIRENFSLANQPDLTQPNLTQPPSTPKDPPPTGAEILSVDVERRNGTVRTVTETSTQPTEPEGTGTVAVAERVGTAVLEAISMTSLGDGQRHALSVLTNLPVAKLNQLKEILQLTRPGVIGMMTLEKFIDLCEDEELDLPSSVVDARGASQFFDSLLAAINNPAQDILSKLLTIVPKAMKADAETAIPLLLAECKKENVTDPDEIAYIMATVQHECRFQPIREGLAKPNSPKAKQRELAQIQAKYIPYFGRGYVQLTHRDNYQEFGKLLGVDLVNQPDLALDPEIAAKVCVIGMKRGLFRSPNQLANFNRATGYDFVFARNIVNGTRRGERLPDKAELIAGFARGYRTALS
ncbi:glycoside hydrolase family 19 protein [Candidatus Cyanaurora vandensis]|uniref:glycoside hydrolase family 19 protein n=1 Tax=Candidatus Cyanaurora vandensis TaxID=2714958 RepID=UPI002581058F|nr:glycoside hydrolase family 19 protein [Candidatus Cyanaurora vandensis]